LVNFLKKYVKEVSFINKANLDTELILDPQCGDTCSIDWQTKHNLKTILADEQLAYNLKFGVKKGGAVKGTTSLLYKCCSNMFVGGQVDFNGSKAGNKEVGTFLKVADNLSFALVYQMAGGNSTALFKFFSTPSKNFQYGSEFAYDKAQNTLTSKVAFNYDVDDNVEIKGQLDNFAKADFVVETKFNDNLKAEWSNGLNLTDFAAGKSMPYHGLKLKVEL